MFISSVSLIRLYKMYFLSNTSISGGFYRWIYCVSLHEVAHSLRREIILRPQLYVLSFFLHNLIHPHRTCCDIWADEQLLLVFFHPNRIFFFCICNVEHISKATVCREGSDIICHNHFKDWGTITNTQSSWTKQSDYLHYFNLLYFLQIGYKSQNYVFIWLQ